MAGKAYVGVYADGPLQVEWVTVPASEGSTLSGKELHAKRTQQDGSSLPPESLFIAVPKGSGRYPVIVLQHGYMLRNAFYKELMEHVASHRFIVVAPQMYNIELGSDATQRIQPLL
ncbi:hypothetical protein O6H91_03G112000 [Diphasiastrum complanatum]|uniref:Uncharacterized protein n=1 Tax=Diphasiastrum complanatum TaxID=34168 RepID=A0ACC2EAU0_DIPCM|nr:hypothetical protein O6H91_03G112000 [Diphasiastrum complanatum]